MARNPQPFLGSNYPADEIEEDEDNKLESKGLRGSNRVVTTVTGGPFPADKKGDSQTKTCDITPQKGT